MENIFRIELNFAGIFISVIIIWLFYKQIKTKSRENKVFLLLVYITLSELVLDSIFWVVDGRQFAGDRQVNLLVNTLYYILQILQCYIWMRYCEIHLQCRESRMKKYLLVSVLILGVVLLMDNLWTGTVFSINEPNIYERSWGVVGSLEAACCMFYPCYCMIMIICKMLAGDGKQRRDGSYLLLVSMIPIISAIIQMIFYGLNFIWVGMAMALLLILVVIEVDQYQRMEQELMDHRIHIMLSQIQPHFLYNALSSITALCDEDPGRAKWATVEFSNFLRGNMDALTADKPISFEQELEHTRHYLSLEQLRFPDKLHIVYHIETTLFRVPTLTLQPIVENAVRYGVTKKREGGSVTITAREEKESYIITVEDDGVGFDPMLPHADGRTHIGITNVRDRLDRMCGGSLSIESILGKGTTAVIRIPKGEKR